MALSAVGLSAAVSVAFGAPLEFRPTTFRGVLIVLGVLLAVIAAFPRPTAIRGFRLIIRGLVGAVYWRFLTQVLIGLWFVAESKRLYDVDGRGVERADLVVAWSMPDVDGDRTIQEGRWRR
jgi:hypothetical protein